MQKIITICLLLLCALTATAQRVEKVHGIYSYTVGDNEAFTFAEMKQRCILRAQNEAIKEKFNENISARTNMVDANINGEAISQFVEEIDVNAAAEWLGDTQAPEISVKYEGNVLTFTAEVWGEAREIVQQAVDFDWKILCGGTTDSYQSNKFNNRDRVFIKFKSPIPGYLAIYVLDSTNKEASCWLPYRSNTSGYFPVAAGKEYVLFDKAVDPYASPYRMVTSKPIEMDKVVLIFSPNAFTKCNDNVGDYKHANSLSIADFKKWLRKARKNDKDMVVDQTQWITIVNDKAKNNN